MRSRAKGERGASLIMVIVFVMVFGLIGAAILDFANTGFDASESTVEVRNGQHAVDGAMEGAINAIRRSNSAGFAGSPVACPTFEYDATDASDPDVTVTCKALGSSTGGSDSTIPEYAVLILGRTGSDGFYHSGSASKVLTIDGGIFSNRVIDAGNASISVFGDVFALKSCEPDDSQGEPTTITATGFRKCHLNDPGFPQHESHPGEADPSYAMQISSLSGLPGDPDASCSNPNAVIRFIPGIYTEDPAGLVPAACKGKVWWFTPGTYYFNFNSNGLWDIPNDISVVGGTLSNGWGVNTNASTISFPDACDPGTASTPKNGVQFILGGDTRIVTSGPAERLELCAGQAGVTDKQRIAVYGLSSGSRTTHGTASNPKNLKANTASSSGNPAFLLPDNAKAIGGLSSIATLGRNQSASLRLENFSLTGLSDFEGAKLLTATLRINRSVGPRITSENVVIDTGRTTKTYNSIPGSGSINILADLDPKYRWKQIRDLKVTYTAVHNNNNQPDTASLDGIELDITYQGSGFQAHGCSPACNILDVGNNGFALFHGTFYAPTASVFVRVHNGQPNQGEITFDRGLIARSVDADAINSSKQTTSPFQLPGVTDRRVVLLEAYLNKDGNPSTPPAAGDLRLRARVSFDDADGLPGRTLRVLDWVVMR